ncbi:MAG: glycosyltransferase family 2 protein [Dehalococcoidia bacterium]
MDITTFAIHVALWLLGFVFLFHIPLCRAARKDDFPYHPPTSVIIPARNEDTVLPNLLASLREQSYIPDEIIVVDDHSEDRTKEIAKREGAKVVESQPLPEGWTGKTWACHQGAQAAVGDILIFLDADTSLEIDGLRSIVETYMEKEGVLSIQPYHRTRRLYEELSSFFNLIMMGAIDAFTVLGSRLKPTALFGAALVLSRQHYVESGGHERVKGKVVEDVALAKELRKQGIPIRCCGGKGTVSFRMYPHGLRQLVDGWSKGFALGAAQIAIPSLLVTVAWIVGSIDAVRYTAQAFFATNNIPIVMWGSLYLGYAAQIYWMLFRIGSFRLYTALLYPIPLLFFIIVFARSFVIVFLKRSVWWKDRMINLRGEASQ